MYDPHQRRGDPLFWAARRVSRILEDVATTSGACRGTNNQFVADVKRLLRHQESIASRWRRVEQALARGWQGAARVERERFVALLESTHYHLADVLRTPETHSDIRTVKPLTTPGLLQELRQLHKEFDDVRIDRRRAIIAVVTDSIELEGVTLGRFRIELHIARLRERQDVSVITCVALQPNPASASSAATQPHVQDTVLCAGDATVPLQRALRQGRLCDAFMIVSAVLHTYNSTSPYVSLEEWHGVACADCDGTTDEDYLCRCESCDRRVCDNCIATCESCDCNVCMSCVERARTVHRESQYLCPACRTTCPRCEHIAPLSDVEELGVCRDCHEEETRQQELEKQEHQDHESDNVSDDRVIDDDDGENDPADAIARVEGTDGQPTQAADDNVTQAEAPQLPAA